MPQARPKIIRRTIQGIALAATCFAVGNAAPIAQPSPVLPPLAGSVLAPERFAPPLPVPIPPGGAALAVPAIVVIPPLPTAPLPADPVLTPAEAAASAERLQRALVADVPHLVHQSPADERRWIALVRAQFAATQTDILRPQLVVVVDRAPAVQQLALLVASPDAAWRVLGAVHVSTGQAGRFDHYVTPTGVFRHTDAILDYRAQGTYNENHIRGLGLKGMRVWDFGWQWARKGWSPGEGKPQQTQIRLEMHATDPAVLEARIGRTASQGCVRIPSTMNRFMDLQGVLDADYEKLAPTDIKYRALLLHDRTPTPLAGDTLVIVDSAAPASTPPDQRGDHPLGNVKGAAATVATKG